jgi:ABC-type multidrug transport system fused ATPase/permease subunit
MVMDSTLQTLYVLSFLQLAILTFWAFTDAINIFPLIYHSMLKMEKFLNICMDNLTPTPGNRFDSFSLTYLIDSIALDPDLVVSISKATFSYEKKKVLMDVNITINKSDFIVVAGDVASGKSSLVLAILGQLRRDCGESSTNATIAYSPQQVFLSGFCLLILRLGFSILPFEKIFFLEKNLIQAGLKFLIEKLFGCFVNI